MKTYEEKQGFLGLASPLCNLETAKVVVVPFGCGGENQTLSLASERLIKASHRVSPYGDDLVSGNFFNIGVATLKKEFVGGEKFKDEKNELAEIVKEIVSFNKIPVILGGDRLASVAPVQVLSEVFGNLVVLSFDAHCNLETADGYSAVSAMSRCVQYAEQIIIAGVRRISPFERKLLLDEDKTKIRCYRMRKNIRRLDGGIKTLIRTLEYWLKNKNVYISFDPDVLSSEIIRDAVPNPEPGGFIYDEISDIFEKLLPKINVAGADFSGLEPKEHNGIEVYMVAKLIGKFIANLKLAQ
jgi:arginase family enzyme